MHGSIRMQARSHNRRAHQLCMCSRGNRCDENGWRHTTMLLPFVVLPLYHWSRRSLIFPANPMFAQNLCRSRWVYITLTKYRQPLNPSHFPLPPSPYQLNVHRC